MAVKLELTDRAIDEALSDLSDEFAREAGELANVFESWRKPEVAREVVESLINQDREAFRALLEPGIDPSDPRDPDETRIAICYKLLLLAEKLGRPKSVKTGTETCRLRTDLSPDERRRYLAIAFQFTDGQIWERGAADVLIGSEGPVVPPGPFLDALKAEGLVKCVPDESIVSLDPRSGVFRGLEDVCGFQL